MASKGLRVIERRTCAVLVMAGLLGGVAIAGSASPGAAARSVAFAPKNCVKPKVKPSKIVLACGDFSLFVRAKHWGHWGAGRARGRGVLRANECVPAASCRPSQFARYHVRFGLHRVRFKRCGGGRVPLFTRMNLRFTKRSPKYAARVRRNALHCAP